MLVLLSPSKSMDFSSKTKGAYTNPEFLDDSSKLIETLSKLSKEEISSLMNLSHKLTELNYERYKEFSTPFTDENAKQAAYAFKGDVYDGLEFDTLNSEDAKFAQNHIRILSGLYGLLRPLDLIQPYRLEMGTKLKNPRGKNLYEFWDKKISEKINEQEKDLVVNLASNEYFKSVKSKLLDAKVISPAFKDYKNGEYKMIMVYAKKARGLMARYIIENKVTTSEKLLSFDYEGYKYNNDLSSKSEPVFTRK
jgi:cytoplasmic iron level regulating protein YaaA (DUF328/UPF0246 family)